MSIKTDTIWEMPPHTGAKHFLLRRYLQAWFPILNTFCKRLVYIDGFSGPGRYKGNEPGSPMIALDVAAGHKAPLEGDFHFIFIEDDPKRFKHLQQELSLRKYPENFHISQRRGLFEQEIEPFLQEIKASYAQKSAVFAFLDPDGISGLSLSINKRLLRIKRSEVFITFLRDAFNRWLKHPEAEVRRHIIEHFGTDEVLQQTSLDALRLLYQRQLGEDAEFIRYFEMRDIRDRSIYDLFFATNNRQGHIKMKEAMWALDPEGKFSFSDATDPEQKVLFGRGCEPAPSNQILRLFAANQRIPVKDIISFIEDKTIYLKKHVKAALRKLESEERILVHPVKSGGQKRKRHSFPDDVLIDFP